MYKLYHSRFSKTFTRNNFFSISRHRYCTTESDVQEKDLYAILGLHPKSTQSEIKKAYYNLTLLYHPDRNEGCMDAAIKFRKVAEAYEILSNSFTRDRYDKGLSVSIDSDNFKPKKKPIDHNVKWQSFYDKRNQPFTMPKSTFGDSESDYGIEKVKKETKEEAQEKYSFENQKQYIFIVLLILLLYFQRKRLSKLDDPSYWKSEVAKLDEPSHRKSQTKLDEPPHRKSHTKSDEP